MLGFIQSKTEQKMDRKTQANVGSDIINARDTKEGPDT